MKVAGELGLDVEQLKKDMEDRRVKEGIAEERALAQKLGVRAPPYT